MSERSDLLNSVANTIKTYRAGQFASPTPQHVETWLNQFTPANQLDFLREFDHVMKQTFFTEHSISGFLNVVSADKGLSSGDPVQYWNKANLLDIQKNGFSQAEMLKLLGQSLQSNYKLDIAQCGKPDGDYIYIDDVIFSGARTITDLTPWITDLAPDGAKLNLITMVNHSGGEYWADTQLKDAARKAGKTLTIKFWRSKVVESRKWYRNNSEVLWPTEIPNVPEVQAYVAGLVQNGFTARATGGNFALNIYSSEKGRAILEREFLIAGVKIRSKIQSPKSVMRPLGFGNFGVGFGSVIATYRNCPNNCPLALWWGDPTHTSGPFSWYPLLPRETYTSTRNVFKNLFG